MSRTLDNYKKNIIDAFGKEPETLDELAQSVISVINYQQDQYQVKDKREVVGFSWEVCHGNVSCTHYAPKGQNTNWGGRQVDVNGKPLPTSFPGFQGRVWIRYKQRFRSDFFQQTLTYTGTGGSGSYNGPWEQLCDIWYKKYGVFRWDSKARKQISYPEPKCLSWYYRFFDSDWPLVTKNYMQAVEQEIVWARLNDLQFSHKIHKFCWQDPEIAARDKEFIEQYGIKLNTK